MKVTNGYGPWGFFADIGGYSLTASAELLNSPLSPSLTLLDASGQVLANNAGIGGRRNAIIDYSFNEPGEYAVRIEDIAGNGGAGYVYHLDVRPTTPDFAISVTPDNPNIGRGGTVLLEVTAPASRRIYRTNTNSPLKICLPVSLQVKGRSSPVQVLHRDISR